MPDRRPNIDIAERHPGVSLNRDQEIDEGEDESAASLKDREDLQKALLSAIRKHTGNGTMDSRGVVEAARNNRNYMRGMQQFYWSEDTQDIVFGDPDAPNDRTFNITQAYGKIFISTFMGAKPKVEPEADNIFEPDSIRDSARAQDFERIWRKKNDISALQMEIGRLLYTDGRIITQSEDREDGQYTLTFGVLESRVAGSANSPEDWTIVQTENEFPMVKMKRKYPDARKKLNSGAGDSYYRNARMAVKRRGGSDTTIDINTAEDATGLVTITKSYATPDFYEHLQEDERIELEEMYPDGLCIIHSGDTYLEDFEYKVHESFDVIHAIPADGMNGPAIVDPLMPVQDSLNTSLNLIEETFDHGIPTTYFDQKTNIDSLNTVRNVPGGSRKMERSADKSAEDHFYTTPVLSPSGALTNYVQQMQGPFAQFVTGLPPAIQGFGDQDQKTASGYAQMRQMALGQMAIVWKPFTRWYTDEMTRCVKMAAAGQHSITGTLEPVTAGAKPRLVNIKPSELKGFKFTNASDENFPETYTERRNAFMQVMQDGDTKAWIMQSPDNLYLAKQYIGLPDLVIPGEDSRNKQLQEISEMESEAPVPDPQQMPEQPLPAIGAPPVVPPLTSSIPVSKYDNDEIEEAECLHWINSSEGQEAKRTKPDWYMNVCLHCDLHTAQKQKKAQAAAPPPEQKPPNVSISIPVDKFTPDIQTQLFGLAGIQVQGSPMPPEDVSA